MFPVYHNDTGFRTEDRWDLHNELPSPRHLRSAPRVRNETLSANAPKFSLIPVGNAPGYETNANNIPDGGALYNTDITRPQMFAMLDAAGLLWHARAYTNPSDCNRPKHPEVGQIDDMHYWCRTLNMRPSCRRARSTASATRTRRGSTT